MIKCNFCEEMFEQHTGQLVWCMDCSSTHKMCGPCYEEAEIGDLVMNKKYKKGDITEENKQRFT